MRAVLFVCLAGVLGLLVAAQPSAAQGVQGDDPDTGPPDVRVKLAGPGEPREIVIGPRGIGVCRQASRCGNHFTVMWVGSRNDGERIRIRFDDQEAAANCFDRTDFTVDNIGVLHRVEVKVLAENPDCAGKAAFFYTVSCEGGEGGDCGGVAPVDPAAVIDG